MLLIGGVIIACIVGVAIFAVNNGSKSNSSASPAGNSASPAGNGGSIVFNPSTIGCPSQSFTTVIRLPASVKGTDELTYQVDGEAVITQTVNDYGIEQQADGSWFLSDTNTQGSANCSKGAGVHTARLLDSNGRVVAQGSFTLVMSASPSPNALSSVTITPSTFSCSAEDSQVTLAIMLSGSIPGSTQVTIQADGVDVTSSSVESGFVMQTDGSWLSSAPESSSALCASLGVGSHTMGVRDASGTVIAVGPFTMTP
jgi:hypothetical protein